jgi:hypothetical protein
MGGFHPDQNGADVSQRIAASAFLEASFLIRS